MGERVSLGGGHFYRLIHGDVAYYPNVYPEHGSGDEGRVLVLVGMIQTHPRPDDGTECEGTVAFVNARGQDRPIWKVISFEPLTVDPSLHCTLCGAHGKIEDGRWTDV